MNLEGGYSAIEGAPPSRFISYRSSRQDAQRMRIAGDSIGKSHCLFQFYVSQGRLSCQLYQRSADIFLGVPFNIASYALLTMMVAQVAGLEPGDFIHTLGDAHLYANHFEQAHEQLSRTPKALPTLWMNPEVKDLFAFRFEDFRLENYTADASIKAPIAV